MPESPVPRSARGGPVTASHPDRDRLAAFASGRLDDRDSAEIEAHLADCDDCRVVLESLPEDSLVDQLRAAGSVGGGPPDTTPTQPWAGPAPGPDDPATGSWVGPYELLEL